VPKSAKKLNYLVAATAGIMAAPALAEQFTIATFNTEFLIRERVHAREGFPLNLSAAQQAEWTPQRRETAFIGAVDRIAPVIAATNANVVVLTEIGPQADVSTLRARLQALGSAYPHVAVCECTDRATDQHVAILSRHPLTSITRALPGREHFLTELDDEETEADTGISKGIKVELTFDGLPVSIYGIHLVSERGGHEDDAQRVAQASIVRRLYLRDIEQARHVIVAGDLNERRGDPTLVRIRGLDDIQPDLIQTGLPSFFEDSEADERWTYEFQGERNQIDHILLSESIRTASTRIRSRVSRVTDPTISDHSPLTVTISFRD
jgi:endonuclease/exonuclease/phosphatase family metal-dependent hydrolase